MWHWFTTNRRKGKQRATGFSPKHQCDDYECSRAKMVHGFCANSKFSNTTNGRESQELTLESKRRSMCNLFAVYQQSNCQVLTAMTDDRELMSPAMALPVKNESPNAGYRRSRLGSSSGMYCYIQQYFLSLDICHASRRVLPGAAATMTSCENNSPKSE